MSADLFESDDLPEAGETKLKFNPREAARSPRYYRQRVLLRLIAGLGDVSDAGEGGVGRVSESTAKTDIQKLLFLFGQEFARGDSAYLYEFIPYEDGCYSLSCDLDLRYLVGKGCVGVSGAEGGYLRARVSPPQIRALDLQSLSELIRTYGKLRGAALANIVSRKYPYYDAARLGSFATADSAEDTEDATDEKTLFTIGYEGISFERYVNTLIAERVRLLCDVRANPVSHKPGFSREDMARILPKVGIPYAGMPGLGVPYHIRRASKNAVVTEKPFVRYRRELQNKQSLVQDLESKLDDYRRVAITCFEKLPAHCHRHCISETIAAARPNIRVRHL